MEINEHQLEPIPRGVEVSERHDEIYLTIKIGNGQIGGTKVSEQDRVLAKGNLTEPVFLGIAANLQKLELDIVTNILDVNSFTNRCVMTTTFLNQHNQVLFSKIDRGDAPENGVASFIGKYVIRILSFLLLIFACSLSQHLSAQGTGELEFKNLETPSSPGFILLDQTPASIEKPTTPQGFGLSLLTLNQKGGALEFAPYWLTDHPNLTAESMYKNKVPILTHFAISVATIISDSVSYLAGGFRTRIYQSYELKAKFKLDSIRKAIEIALADGDFASVEELRNEYVSLTEKPIFNIDFAMAFGGGAESNSFQGLELSRWAAWMSLNWRPKADDFYFTVLGRYINNDQFEDYNVKADLIDLGTRFNYDISRVTVSLEYLQRMNFTDDIYDDYRIAAIASYEIVDNIFITSTFGKNFTDVNNIIALAGVNFGFSNKKTKAYQ